MSSESTPFITEAQRQLQICNACRYCEGFCAVFPAVHRLRNFSTGDVTQLANLCHNCRGCHYACQYSEPHEFKINIPRALANVRVESWERFARPASFARCFQRHGVAIATFAIVAIASLLLVINRLPLNSGEGFYRYLSHNAMIALFIPAFLAPIIVLGFGLRAYWREVQGQPVKWPQVRSAMSAAATMKNLSGRRDGDQAPGCNFELEDRYTHNRRYAHQATLWGFLLCFASTSSATLMHYLLDMPAPYNLWSLPKLLGVVGGIALVVGCSTLAWLKTLADSHLGPQWRGGEMAFVVLLGLTGFTGLILYAATGTHFVAALLAIHLGTVLTLFLLLPYSRMAHGAYRIAALIREAQHKTD